MLACLQAVIGGFIAENPFRSVISPPAPPSGRRHLRFLRRALPGTSGRAHESREVNPQPGPDLAARFQDADLITNSGFFRPSNCLRAGYIDVISHRSQLANLMWAEQRRSFGDLNLCMHAWFHNCMVEIVPAWLHCCKAVLVSQLCDYWVSTWDLSWHCCVARHVTLWRWCCAVELDVVRSMTINKYTCLLSRLTRESHAHACGLKTLISRWLTPAGQFLTPDWKMWVVAILLDTISKNMLTQTHVRNENHVKNEQMTIPRSLIFEVKSSGSELAFIRVLRLRKTSDFFGNLRKWTCRLQKSQHS